MMPTDHHDLRRRSDGLPGPALLLTVVAFCLASQPARAQVQPDPKPYIEQIKKAPTASASAAAKLIDNWQTSLVPLVTEIGTYNVPITPDQTGALQQLEGLTDVLRSIIVNQDGATRLFRTKANGNKQAIKNLIWAAQSDDKALRINATYVLANVADNTNMCLILDQLVDPKLTPDGRINLLQVVQVVASYAYKQNVTSTKATVQKIQADLARDRTGNARTLAIADDVLTRLDKSKNKDDDLIRAGLDINKCSDERTGSAR